jgi:hypothetical protein
MTRSFSAAGLVRLPHLSSSSAVALGDRLLAVAAKQPSVPALLVASHERLGGAHGELREARVFMDEVQAADPNAAPAADLWVDTTWGALYWFLKAWARLTSAGGRVEERGERAKHLLEGVFSDGLRFLKLPYDQEWAETQKRLDRLHKPDFAEHIEAIGARPFVEAVERAFEAYSAALRKGEGKPAVAPRLREPLAHFVAALRSYVLSVTAYGDLGGEGSAERALADALLAPLATWQAAGAGRKGKGEPDGRGEAADGGEGEGGEGPSDAE